MSDLRALQARLITFRDARGWGRYHTAPALARAIAVEAGELNALFLWGRDPLVGTVAQEVADVMIYCLNLCNAVSLEADTIIADKIALNERRAVAGDGFVKEPA